MYCELHCHSAFSFLDGTSHPERLALEASQLGYRAVALTDHNGLYGSMAFAQAALQYDIQPITGAEVTLLDGSHVTLLAENPAGYANLCRLLTEAHLGREDRRDPRLAFESLVARHEGLILLTGCRQGLLPRVLEQQGIRAARRCADQLSGLFGAHRVFVELQRHMVRGDRDRNRALCDIADSAGLPVVATGDVHYHKRELHRLQDVLVAIRNRTTLDGSHRLRRQNGEFFLRPPADVAAFYRDRPDAVTNTVLIAERCRAFDLTRDLGYTFPDFRGADRQTAPQALAELCRQRLDDLYPADSDLRERAIARLEEELRLVRHHNLCGFFLVYRDLLDLAREVAADVRAGSRRAHSNLLPGRGRGSSVSSIICYFLGLSHIDPVANDLFLGRFLNEELASVPDIDLDFPREIREELIRRVYRRYGDEHVGLVCAYPTYHLRSAVREIGKALDLPMGELEQIAKLAEHFSAGAIRGEMRKIPGLADKVDAPLWRDLCGLAEEIAGLPRHISQHVGGMIISSRPLVEIVPLERSAMPDRVLCQWDKDSCDDARFIKIDFLALGMLSLVEECVELVARGTGSPPDLSRIDFDDAKIYDSICSGDTVGLFQIESRAQIQMIRRTRPRNLRDLAMEVAIVRPGPIVGGAVNPYVRRREEERRALEQGIPWEPELPHPLLKEALGETLGVVIYQDQVLQVCQALAGFSAGQAEALRRAMSRRRSREMMESFWEQFRDGAARNGVREPVARRVFEQVVAFSEFGFPKSHAAAFGLLAYQSAWLRYYYPVEYYVALFNNQPMGFYSLDALTRDAERHGIDVLLPDVNESEVYCTAAQPPTAQGERGAGSGERAAQPPTAQGEPGAGSGERGATAVSREPWAVSRNSGGGEPGAGSGERGALRVGLGFVRDIGWDVAEELVCERERGGPFLGVCDLVRRAPVSLGRDGIENLVWVGGCDSFGLSRRDMIWQVGLMLPPRSEDVDPARRRRQLELPFVHPYERLRFGGVGSDEKLVAEYDVLGFAASGHPLSLVREALPAGLTRAVELPHRDHDSQVLVAGLVVARQRPETAKGVTFILMEDETGHINCIVRPQVYEKCRISVRGEPFLIIRGRLARDDGTFNILAEEVLPLRADRPELRVPDFGGRSAGHFLKKLRGNAPKAKSWR